MTSMARINLRMAAITNYTAEQRAEAVSVELLKISEPNLSGISQRVFPWFNDGENVVLICDGDYVIKVHPSANLDTLKSLMPEVSEAELNQLVAYVTSVDSFVFKNIIPSTANKIDEYTYGM